MGKPWVAYSWLFEVITYGLYEAFGLAGVVVLTAALSLSNLVIASVNAALTSFFRLDTRFVIVYEDTTAAVFVARAKE